MPQKQELPKSIVFSEVNAVTNRVKMILDNSDDPVEQFVAYQILPVLGNMVTDVVSILTTEHIDSIAIDFMKTHPVNHIDS